MNKNFFIYILTNTYNTVFYTGMTNDLEFRAYTHKNKTVNSFTKRYNIWKLVYYEIFTDVNDAIVREKQVKDYRREKKLRLIISMNPEFKDISKGISHFETHRSR